MINLLAGIALAALAPVQPAATTSDFLPAAEWTSRMVMSFTPDGELNGCRLEGGGALESPAGADADCMSDAAAGRQAGRGSEIPDATTNVIFEQRFVPAVVSAESIADSPGDELVSRRFLRVDIGANGRVKACRAMAGGEGSAAPMDGCKAVADGFNPPLGKDGRPAALTGTIIMSVYVRAEAIA